MQSIPFCLLDEEENLFAPPKLTDEDFSPFGSRGGLFSGGKGLFDDEDEEVSPW